jgi:protocatechuate 3,4-dioxygenase alpha subunit
VLVGILGRGIFTRLVTRAYFEDDESLPEDPILETVPVARHATLLARRAADGRYRFDIVLQGDGETVFFDV